MTVITDAWLESARQFIVQFECDCDCFICARGEHDAEHCPHAPDEEAE